MAKYRQAKSNENVLLRTVKKGIGFRVYDVKLSKKTSPNRIKVTGNPIQYVSDFFSSKRSKK